VRENLRDRPGLHQSHQYDDLVRTVLVMPRTSQKHWLKLPPDRPRRVPLEDESRSGLCGDRFAHRSAKHAITAGAKDRQSRSRIVHFLPTIRRGRAFRFFRKPVLAGQLGDRQTPSFLAGQVRIAGASRVRARRRGHHGQKRRRATMGRDGKSHFGRAGFRQSRLAAVDLGFLPPGRYGTATCFRRF